MNPTIRGGVLLVYVSLLPLLILAQPADSTHIKTAREVTIEAWETSYKPIPKLPEVHNGWLLSGKSNQVISLDQMPTCPPDKSVRQVFAKTPGAFAYDMDGAGNQINLALRGLDPHRSWDMNVRQNGAMLNSDLYGYPASHYVPPLEAVDRIELVRGTASLQYGAQFGGMMNYVIRMPDTLRKAGYHGQASVGSFGTASHYHAVGGRIGKWTWQAYHFQRVSEGYRENSRSTSEAQYARLIYQATPRLKVSLETGRSTYLYQIPGPLNDSAAQANPRQATRSRNFYSPDIFVPVVSVEWKPGRHTRIDWVTSGILGDRSSVQFIGGYDKPDVLVPATGTFAPRQVDIDLFRSFTSEARLLHTWKLGGMDQAFAAGFRAIGNELRRQQLGLGSAGFDYDLGITGEWGRDVRFRTHNYALFAENLVYLTPRLRISPGIRIEQGLTRMRGSVRNVPEDRVPADLPHQFVLLGVSGKWEIRPGVEVFGGWSQAYRPVILGEAMPTNALERVDPGLKNSFGSNSELGLDASLFQNRLRVTATAFMLDYRRRVGLQAMEDDLGQTYFLRTNIGDSRTLGVELYAEYLVLSAREAALSVFTATAWMHGRYVSGEVLFNGQNVDITGNVLEHAPTLNSRNGVQASWKRLSASVLLHIVTRTYSDPVNTETPTTNGARGLVPGYALTDVQAGYRFSPRVQVRAALNNAFDQFFFTKRPTIYPGPGVWPSEGRNFTVTLSYRL